MYILYFYGSIVFLYNIFSYFGKLINVDNLLSCNAHLIIFTCILRNINIKLLLLLLLSFENRSLFFHGTGLFFSVCSENNVTSQRTIALYYKTATPNRGLTGT